jgi:cell division protein FtsL
VRLSQDELVRKPVGPPPVALRLAAVLVIPIVLYVLGATGQKALDNYRLNQEAEALRAEVLALRNENIDLQQQILDARTDASIEAIARQELGLVRPGDNAVILVSSPAAPTGSATPPAPAPPVMPVWRQWWDYFFG